MGEVGWNLPRKRDLVYDSPCPVVEMLLWGHAYASSNHRCYEASHGLIGTLVILGVFASLLESNA